MKWIALALLLVGCGEEPEMNASPFQGTSMWSTNWASEVLLTVPGQPRSACGQWTVPVHGGPVGDKAADWVGIGGAEVLNPQVGHNCNIIQTGVIALRQTWSTTYKFFWQFWPGAYHESSLAVAPGDSVQACVAVNPNGSGTFQMWNITRGQISSVVESAPSGSFCAGTVEWVVERPPLGSGLSPLASFSSFTMAISASDGTSPIPIGDPGPATSAPIDMINGSSTLADAAFTNGTPDTVTFTWLTRQ